MNVANITEKSIAVKKFGGTSVGSVRRIEAVADRISEDIKAGQTPVIILSAMSGETNRLIKLAADVNPNYRGRAYDMLLASGEQVSISLLVMALEKRGILARPLLAYQIGIKTSAIFSNARIQSIDYEKINKVIDQGQIPVIAGFQGLTGEDITTLGRGGSDTSAIAIAAALKSESCEIFTDVPAIFTADPRVVPKAKELSILSFDEMMEMASLGSKVLHYRSVELAAKFKIKIHLRSTFEKREGTWVVPEGENMEAPVVSSITHDTSMAIIKIFPLPWNEGVMAELFTRLNEKNVVVDIITQSHNDEGQRLAFSVSEADISLAVEIVNSIKPEDSKVDIMKDVTKISAVGVGMKNHPGVAARFFKTLHEKSIPIHLVTTSEIKMSAVIQKKDLLDAANALHSEFGLDKEEA